MTSNKTNSPTLFLADRLTQPEVDCGEVTPGHCGIIGRSDVLTAYSIYQSQELLAVRVLSPSLVREYNAVSEGLGTNLVITAMEQGCRSQRREVQKLILKFAAKCANFLVRIVFLVTCIASIMRM